VWRRTCWERACGGGLLGDFAIDRCGDATLNTTGIYQIRRGRLHDETAITPDQDLLARG
jgi:hypothetical protein